MLKGQKEGIFSLTHTHTDFIIILHYYLTWLWKHHALIKCKKKIIIIELSFKHNLKNK